MGGFMCLSDLPLDLATRVHVLKLHSLYYFCHLMWQMGGLRVTTATNVGLPTSPPYLSLNSNATPPITEVIFASGGSGVLDGTGVNYVPKCTYHNPYSQSLITGDNDISAYFTVGFAISRQYTPQQFVDLMLSTFKRLLKVKKGVTVISAGLMKGQHGE
ncbi:SGNH hydrolase-type esterase domain-containing protein [Artemisia annua]|uniref:SGNH hydrolase-type esterase domain-containing protein n=1 Tax=Artemisia annua TaxID=35608 RepID=A0A2U1MD76_ARTAN|nr:SGNH hydrolase-type esterase domain-containing protein [Artemisia annua]